MPASPLISLVYLALAASALAQVGRISIPVLESPIAIASAPLTSSSFATDWFPINTIWNDTSRTPTPVSISVTSARGRIVFTAPGITSPQNTITIPLVPNGGVAYTGSGEAPASYFAFAATGLDPSGLAISDLIQVAVVSAANTTDWPAAGGPFLTQNVSTTTRPLRFSALGHTAHSLVPGIPSAPIDVEFGVPVQQPTSVSISTDPSIGACGTAVSSCPSGFYSYQLLNPDGTPNGAPSPNTLNASLAVGDQQLRFQIIANLNSLVPFDQRKKYQDSNGVFSVPWVPSSGAPGTFALPNLRLAMAGGDANQYLGTATLINFQPVASIVQVPVFLDGLSTAATLVTGETATFTYRLANAVPGTLLVYDLRAPAGISVSPPSITFDCSTPASGPSGCPTSASVQVSVGPHFVLGSFGTIEVTAVQPAAALSMFPVQAPSISINVVDRKADDALTFDAMPASVAVGQSFMFSVRLFNVPPTASAGLVLSFNSNEFRFDQPSYSFGPITSILVTATAVGNAAFSTPIAVSPSAPIASVQGYIRAILSGPDAAQYVTGGIVTNANTVIFDMQPVGGITIYRYQFVYQHSTILNGGTTYALSAWNVPSAPITVALKAGQPKAGVTLTPIINCAQVSASGPLVFAAGTNSASFTLMAMKESHTHARGTAGCTVQWAISGADAANYLPPVAFSVTVPAASATPNTIAAYYQSLPSPWTGNRAFQIALTIDYLPPSDVTVHPVWPLGSFSPASVSWSSTSQSLTQVVTVSETDLIDDTAFTPAAVSSQITYAISGTDAGLYSGIAAFSPPAFSFRSISLPSAVSLSLGVPATLSASIQQIPTAGTLVLTPVVKSPLALTFSPSSYTWTTGSPSTFVFTVVGNSVGSWQVEWALTGSDAWLYTSGLASAQIAAFSVAPKSGLSVDLSSAASSVFVAGFWYGPFAVKLASFIDAPQTNGGLVVTPSSSDFVFNPSVLSFPAGAVSQTFQIMFAPGASAASTSGSTNFVANIEWDLSGPEAWQYAVPASLSPAVVHRSVQFLGSGGTTTVALSAPTGVPVLMWVTLPDGPVPTQTSAGGLIVTLSSENLLLSQVAPAWGSTGASKIDIAFQGPIVRQQVYVWTTISGPWGDLSHSNAGGARFSISASIRGPDSAFYLQPAPDALYEVFTLAKRHFVWDVRPIAEVAYENVAEGGNKGNVPPGGAATASQFVIGQATQPITIGTTGLVTTNVTLTPVCGTISRESIFSVNGSLPYSGCPWIQFTPPQLSFGAGDQVKSFQMTPRDVPPVGNAVYISWAITGPEAPYWTIIAGGFPSATVPIQIVPSLVFSPIPAIYIDGSADNLFVSLADPVISFPPFQLQVTPSVVGSVISPDTFSFFPGGPTIQSFRIWHPRPADLPATDHYYKLTWKIKYAGTDTAFALDPRVVPVDATEIRVIRHSIIPNFPLYLGLDWQPASINISRPPLGSVALIPNLPNINGKTAYPSGAVNVGGGGPDVQYAQANENGNKIPGGRVIFDPPAVTFVAGQAVSQFNVRVDRLHDNEAIYLRVDWTPVFHAEDVNAYYPFVYTWHMAGASSTAAAWLLLLAASCALLL